MNFKIGQTVVHCRHGVGSIVSIETRTFKHGETSSFYILEVNDGGAPKKVFIPTDSENSRLRPVSDELTRKRALSKLESGECDTTIEHQTWNRVYRDLMERVNTGDLMELVEVANQLRHRTKFNGELSFGERKLLECAMERIQSETEGSN
jgi:CarD family transcriptional regulator